VSAPGSTTQADVSFSGNILCNLYDSDIQKAAVDVDTDRSIHNFTTLGGLLNISSAAVQNGRFSLNFTVPKDISFSNKNGRMFFYAVNSANTKHGRGMTTSFTLGGVDETAVNDQRGPEIRLFMDTRTFRAGDLVDSTPRLIADLYDTTGINATGSGIGHDIQCWVDESLIPINLTSSFRISLADPRRGEVNRVLAKLAPGEHRVRVRAWDVFNNFSEAETYFRVASGGGTPILTDVLNFPNPFTASTTIRFRHNQLMAQPYSIVISTITGAVVKTLPGKTSARTMEVPWDGRNENGIQVANGAYIYRVDLTSANGEVKTASGLMVVSR
jgi:FlgD Ig-like domain